MVELDPLRRRESWIAHTAATHSLAFHPDGWTLATGGAGGAVKIWQLPDLQLRQFRMDKQALAVQAVAYSPDGSRLAALSARPVILAMWQRGQSRKGVRLPLSADWGLALCFAAAHDRLAAGLERQVAVWD